MPGIKASIERAEEPMGPFSQALAGLREARADLMVMVEMLSADQLGALDSLLRSEAGVTLDDLQSKRLGQLKALRARGRLTTDEQLRLVAGRLDQISGNPEFADETRELESLRASYEAKRMRRRL